MHNVHESWDGPIFPTIIKKLETFGNTIGIFFPCFVAVPVNLMSYYCF